MADLINDRDDPHERSIAFRCNCCTSNIGDPQYRAPAGHGPCNICLDCWASQWDDRKGLGWDTLDFAMYLYAVGGFSQAEVAQAVGKSRWAVRKMLAELRSDEEKCFQTVANIAFAVSKYGREKE